MQQSCTYGSVRGAAGDRRPYRDETLAAFDGRCILGGGVALPLNTPGIRGRRALPPRRLARLGATPAFHHGLLDLVDGDLPDVVAAIEAALRHGRVRHAQRDAVDAGC